MEWRWLTPLSLSLNAVLAFLIFSDGGPQPPLACPPPPLPDECPPAPPCPAPAQEPRDAAPPPPPMADERGEGAKRAFLSPSILAPAPCGEDATLNLKAREPLRSYGCAHAKWLAWALGVNDQASRVFSQFGEDGITMAILDKIGHGSRKFLEFGVQGGQQRNTRILQDRHNWTGTMFDNAHDNPGIGLYQHLVTEENALSLFKKYHVPMNVDFFSLDINFGDWHMMEFLMRSGFRPNAIVVEFNRNFDAFAAITVDRESAVVKGEMWRGSRYFGASALAFTKLLDAYGYTLLAVSKQAVNIFFARTELLGSMDFPLLNWLETISKNAQMGVPEHKGMAPRPWQHVCVSRLPCIDSTVW